MAPLRIIKQVRREVTRQPDAALPRSAKSAVFDELSSALRQAHNERRSEDVRAIVVQLFQIDTRAAHDQQLLIPVWKHLYKMIVAALDAHSASPSNENHATVQRHCDDGHKVLDQLYQQLSNLGNRKSGLRVLQRLYMYMGDIHRYEARAATSSGMPEKKCLQHALLRYTAAWKMAPGIGHSSNQLALVYQSRQETLLSLYFYLRALFSSEDAFPKAVDNIDGVLASHELRGGSSLDVFEDSAVALIGIFWRSARTLDGVCNAGDIESRTNRVMSSLRTYVADGAMFDLGAALPLRLLLSLMMCCNGSRVSPILTESIRRLQDYMFELRNSEATLHTKVSLSFDAIESLGAAAEVSARWVAAHARINTPTWSDLRVLSGREVETNHHPPGELSSAKLWEDRELEGMLVMWDANKQQYLPMTTLTEYYGPLQDTILPNAVAASVRFKRLVHMARAAALGRSVMYADGDDDDDIIVLAEHEHHCNDDLF
jgi:hypothetical protein